MDIRSIAIALLSVLFLGLAFGTTTGLFRFSLVGGTQPGTAAVLAVLGVFGVIYVAWRRRR